MPTYPISIRYLSFLLLSIALLGLAGCGSDGGQRNTSEESWTRGDVVAGSDTFPVPAEIQPNVDFWRHVYGIWGRGEVAIHDEEHMGVVYEVIKLPSPIKEGYTDPQRSLVRDRTDSYKGQLRLLEERVRTGQSLSSSDKALLAKLEQAGGRGAVYGAADRVRSQRGLRERFHRGVEISGRYDTAFREIMRSHGVPEDLAYLPHVESSFQTNARSGVGAAGVWQFMPATGRMYMNVNDTVDERLDPIIAADGAARYLSQAHRRLGSWPLAITSYNHGQGGMANAKAQHGNDIGDIVKNYRGQYFGFASRNFYAEFIAAREVTRNADRYFPEGVRREEPWPHDRLVLQHSMPVDHVAGHYGLTPYRLADLNMHWRDPARDGRANLPAGSTVWLPAGTKNRVAGHPPPVSTTMVARVKPKASPVDLQAVAKVGRQSAKPVPAAAASTTQRVAKVSPKQAAKASTKQQVAKAPTAQTAKKSTTASRYHVVKPQETLYRVAVQNGITVAELRKLNKMRPDDNNIRPGQKLKVSI
ncbi:lytic transglycosylase domain-containing protein [Thiocapsa roseopersicina]|uniref:Membrane-bound lytic murein transglycosylase D n=1 Tax=Thiocapsa roseopersicina TaxID=1058 RepID=A0A1H3AEC5_THIRO|nr:lytic transglycosylase domain-containing protein [Thiocapsa roseopersicina]SDX27821.1 membrane-bound lytic murein transglycosylase D [Thiocapsa roseopersicina]